MSFDQVPHDGETQAQAALRSIDSLPLLHTQVEYPRKDVRRDTHACVAHTDDNLATVSLGPNRDVTSWSGVLRGVGEQVGDDLAETGRIPLHGESLPLHVHVERMGA